MRRRLALITALLLLGAALRLHGLGAMRGMVHYDEAYYGVDALSLLAQPRLMPFFPANFGRESLWMYLLAPSLAVFGGSAFGLRIVAAFTGIVTLAAVYRLARELLGGRGAAWTLAALAVLFPHVLASHEAFRALLFPCVGALAFAGLWRARRTNRMRGWLIGGALLGTLAYTYLAARLWIALAGVLLLWWMRRRASWRGVVAAGALAVVIALPLILYLLGNAAAADQRLDQVAATEAATLANNVAAWLRVWTVEGAQDVMYNLPGRPLLDFPLALLAACGLVGLLRLRRDKALWLLGLAAASIAPALLTTDPLKPLRFIGLYVPLALLLGLGAVTAERFIRWAAGNLTPKSPLYGVERGLQNTPRAALIPSPQSGEGAGGEVKRLRFVAAALPALLLAIAGANTLRDFDRWLGSPDLFMPMEQHLYSGIDWLADNTPGDAPVYFAPFSTDHPVLRLREWRLGSRPVGAFMPAECLALTDGPAYYLTINAFTPEFTDWLGQYAAVTTVDAADPRFSIYRAEPSAAFPDAWTTFGGRIAVENLAALPGAAKNGDTLDLSIAFRRVGAVDQAYTLFAHLYGVDAQGGVTLVGQDDAPICSGDPPALWREDETIIQRYHIPVDTAASGQFSIGIGIYDSLTQERLPIDAETTIQPIHRLRIN